MKDVAGRELKVGQTVAFAGTAREGHSASLCLGTLARFTPKMVGVVRQGFGREYETLKSPGSLAIVREP